MKMRDWTHRRLKSNHLNHLNFTDFHQFGSKVCVYSLCTRVRSGPAASELKVSEMVLGEDCLLRSMLLIIGLVPTDRTLNPSQMTFLMTSYKKSRERRCREPPQTTAMMATPWTSTWPWLVIYTCVDNGDNDLYSLQSSFCFPSVYHSSGVESCPPGLRSENFPSRVEKSGFHLLGDARPEIWNCAEEGSPYVTALLQYVIPVIWFQNAILSVF